MTKAEHYVNAITMFESRFKHRNCIDIVLSLRHNLSPKSLVRHSADLQVICKISYISPVNQLGSAPMW